MPAVWAGIDSGKRAHHCVVIDQTGEILLSQRIDNDETVLLEIIATVTEIADGHEVVWATDLNSGGAALLISLLVDHGQQLLYIPGRIIHHAAATYRGDGKTDAKDARIIADQARMRTDLQPVRDGDQISIDLKLLTARRLDIIHDRVRAINRLRATMLEYFPALERAFDYSKSKAALTLLSTYQTPGALRRRGVTRLAAWLKARGCRNSATVAQKAIDAAREQETCVAHRDCRRHPRVAPGRRDHRDRRGAGGTRRDHHRPVQRARERRDPAEHARIRPHTRRNLPRKHRWRPP